MVHSVLGLCNYYYSASADGVDCTRANQSLTFQSHARSKVTSLIDRLKYTCDVTRDPSSIRQLYQCNDYIMDVSQLNRAYVATCGHVGSIVVKRKSCETYWI